MTHVFATYAFMLGIRSGDLPLGAATSLFMFPILGMRRCSFCAACANAARRSDDRDRYSHAIDRRRGRELPSLTRNRRWALFASYFFLVLFAIFFWMPPYYMVVTSLKTNAEVAPTWRPIRGSSPDGITFDHFRSCSDADRLSDLLQEYGHRHGLRGRHHDGGERARRLFARPHEILGLGHPRDRHLPDLPGARLAPVHPAVPDRGRSAC